MGRRGGRGKTSANQSKPFSSFTASMGARRGGRKICAAQVSAPVILPRFNGAAPGGAENHTDPNISISPDERFNGAAPGGAENLVRRASIPARAPSFNGAAPGGAENR